MADSSPLAGLLDRAGKVFTLAGKLGRAFHEDFQRSRSNPIDSTGWNRHAATFNELWQALLALREPMEQSSDGCTIVIEELRKAAQLAQAINDAVGRNDGHGIKSVLEYFPELNSIAEKGLEAIKAVTPMERNDNPLAFLTDPPNRAAVKQTFTLLDRFPATAAGHLKFLERVRDDIHVVAEEKRHQRETRYPNATLESMLSGIHWKEAALRVSALIELPAELTEEVARVLSRELSVGTAEQIDTFLTPAVTALREAFETAKSASQSNEKGIIKRSPSGPPPAENVASPTPAPSRNSATTRSSNELRDEALRELADYPIATSSGGYTLKPLVPGNVVFEAMTAYLADLSLPESHPVRREWKLLKFDSRKENPDGDELEKRAIRLAELLESNGIDANVSGDQSAAVSPIVVFVERLQAKILKSDKTFDLSSEQSARFLKVLSDRPGVWVSGPNLKDYDSELDGARTDRLKKSLHPALQRFIETSRRHGSRITLG